jgi:hypothetical protein
VQNLFSNMVKSDRHRLERVLDLMNFMEMEKHELFFICKSVRVGGICINDSFCREIRDIKNVFTNLMAAS